jgi:two-component system, OmpR family, response regulator
MLVLTRRLQEKIVFPTVNATVQVIAVKGGAVRLGIEAPPEVPIQRAEVRERALEWQPDGDPSGARAKLHQLSHLLQNRLNIAATGLGLLQRQLQAGMLQDAELTLGRVEDELELLRQRLEVEAQEKLEPAATRPCQALLVEDDSNERELLASFLRLAGIRVDTAGDGAAALDYLHGHERPDVVLMDMGLPRCDGATAVREIRRDPRLAGLKIFAVSGHTPDEYSQVSGPGGVDRWFCKPLDPALLVRDLNQSFNGDTPAKA